MKSILVLFGLTVFMTSTAHSAQLAVYEGKIQSRANSVQLSQGQWISISNNCAQYVGEFSTTAGFVATKKVSSSETCTEARVVLDLEGSSYCDASYEGFGDVFIAPKVISIECL